MGLMSTASSNAEGHGNRGARTIAVQPFVEALNAELFRCSEVISNQQTLIESSAEALLKNIDGLSRRKSKMSKSEVAHEIAKSRKSASTLLDKTLRVNANK